MSRVPFSAVALAVACAGLPATAAALGASVEPWVDLEPETAAAPATRRAEKMAAAAAKRARKAERRRARRGEPS